MVNYSVLLLIVHLTEFNNYCVLGSPCAKQNNRCIHGVCEEIKHGEDFICHCDKAFTGNYFLIYIKFSYFNNTYMV